MNRQKDLRQRRRSFVTGTLLLLKGFRLTGRNLHIKINQVITARLLCGINRTGDREMKGKRIKVILAAGFMAAALFSSGCVIREVYAEAQNETAASEPASEAETETVSDRIERAASSVFLLEVYDKKGTRIANGSGFSAESAGLLITSAHVAEYMDHVMVTSDSGDTFRIDELIGINKEADIAFLKLPQESETDMLPLSEEKPERADTVYTVSSPKGILNLVSDGVVSGFREENGIEWMIFTAPVSDGSSGGVLLNEAGEAVGMIIGMMEKTQGINLALPAAVIRELLPTE